MRTDSPACRSITDWRTLLGLFCARALMAALVQCAHRIAIGVPGSTWRRETPDPPPVRRGFLCTLRRPRAGKRRILPHPLLYPAASSNQLRFAAVPAQRGYRRESCRNHRRKYMSPRRGPPQTIRPPLQALSIHSHAEDTLRTIFVGLAKTYVLVQGGPVPEPPSTQRFCSTGSPDGVAVPSLAWSPEASGACAQQTPPSSRSTFQRNTTPSFASLRSVLAPEPAALQRVPPRGSTTLPTVPPCFSSPQSNAARGESQGRRVGQRFREGSRSPGSFFNCRRPHTCRNPRAGTRVP